MGDGGGEAHGELASRMLFNVGGVKSWPLQCYFMFLVEELAIRMLFYVFGGRAGHQNAILCFEGKSWALECYFMF